MFQLGWALVNAASGTQPDTTVVAQAKPIPLLPLWVACPLRIVYNEEDKSVDTKSTAIDATPPSAQALPEPESPAAPTAQSDSKGKGKGRKGKKAEEVAELAEPVAAASESLAYNSTKDKMTVSRFAASCLQGHYLQGEERFQVELHDADGSVWCAC
jgi:Domain of unknown function (DUF1990)